MIIRHATGSYSVEFTTLPALMQDLPERCVIVTDEQVAGVYGSLFPAQIPVLALPPGETTKSSSMLDRAVRWLASIGADRQTIVLSLGGGVVGDLAGFTAASYMRGIRYVQAPTTLMAQVDSSVGGKVGIDLPEGKNLMGAFWPPLAVRIPLDALKTLPLREFRNGAAEVWKYGYILEESLVKELEKRPLAPGDDRLEKVIRECISLKAAVVEADEREVTGRRAILNFGHTAGHALETLHCYEGLLHGEAISIGMVLEAKIGERLGFTPSGTIERVKHGLGSQGLPTHLPPGIHATKIVEAMLADKKATDGKLAFSLLERIGACKLYQGIDPSEVEKILSS